MKKIICLSFFLLFIQSILSAQISTDDIEFKFDGISPENQQNFEEKVEVLTQTLNKFDVPEDIAPILVEVMYEDGEGAIAIRANYKSDLFQSTRYQQMHGPGVDIKVVDYIFSALSSYKRAVATNGMNFNNDISELTNIIRFTKENENWINFYSYNRFQSGYYRHFIYPSVRLEISKTTYDIETKNPQALSEIKYFVVSNETGLGGKKTGSYYFKNFFQLSSEK